MKLRHHGPLAVVLLLLPACAPREETVVQPEETAAQAPAEPAVVLEERAPTAEGVWQSAADRAVSGRVVVRESGEGIDVRVEVAGAPPGELGLHLHEVGDCSAPDFSSAGGHFNPDAHPHAAPTAEERHAGDFGNITIGEDGSGVLVLASDRLTVAPGPRSVVGRAVILHERADDLATQPTGNAGGRIACAVLARVGDEGAGDEAAGEEGDSTAPAAAAPAQ